MAVKHRNKCHPEPENIIEAIKWRYRSWKLRKRMKWGKDE